MKLSIIILAAGQGTRMYSDTPKVLHQLAHKPLLSHVIDTSLLLKPNDIFVVYGHGGEKVRDAFPHASASWVKQKEQLGTGHAVAQAIPLISDDNMVLVLYGDVPLIRPETLKHLTHQVDENNISLLTTELSNPFGYGRIVRDEQNQVIRIVEEKDADNNIKTIKEVNTGILAAPAHHLRQWLKALKNDNKQGEYYLTDVIAMAKADKLTINTSHAHDNYEVMGVNDRVQLATLERYYQLQQAQAFMKKGVTLRDPNRFDVRGEVQIGRDTEIDVNVILEGKVTIGDRVKIGANTVIRNSDIAADSQILENCVIEESKIGQHCQIGPFARLRPQAQLSDKVKVGNFVEIKKSQIAANSKINHLSYIGDTEMGSNVNIGAGTITCNYDGANKHKTIIGNGVFVGSDTQLIAPITIGNNATIGAGSTISQNAPEDVLTLSRVRQVSIPKWQRPIKKK